MSRIKVSFLKAYLDLLNSSMKMSGSDLGAFWGKKKPYGVGGPQGLDGGK
jgi:hypothetical protein